MPRDQNLGSRPGDLLTLCDIMVYKGAVGKANEAERQWRRFMMLVIPLVFRVVGKANEAERQWRQRALVRVFAFDD